MQVTESGSVRVDLVGGTLDLEPINLIIPNVVTLNVATSLKANVTIESSTGDKIVINSLDYAKSYEFNLKDLTQERLYFSNEFKEMSFVLQIIHSFGIRTGLKVELSSGAPAGSGLGGSSAMGVTLYKALCKLQDKEVITSEAVSFVRSIESRILNRGVAGYQDYYPALVGGILAVKGSPEGLVYEQLYTEDLSEYLQDHITLVYSGVSRNSGINNWDVYKSFFDQNDDVRSALSKIAEVSFKTYEKIKDKDLSSIAELIGIEGSLRETLAQGIVPSEVANLFKTLKSSGLVSGIKMCGAGGGGCFILLHAKKNKEELNNKLKSARYQVLDFVIEKPL